MTVKLGVRRICFVYSRVYRSDSGSIYGLGSVSKLMLHRLKSKSRLCESRESFTTRMVAIIEADELLEE